jgi:hypothetical protein
VAAPGLAPKPPEQRRNRAEPRQGEWITLPAELYEPVLPPYRRSWSIPARFWRGWREDPITSQYTKVDVELAVYLAERFEELDPAARLRLMDRLGMSPAARRTLRWRTPLEEAQQVEAVRKAKEVRRMRLVGDVPPEKAS